ncbi:Beta propeller domain protein [Candidatus Izimaplasma bacterium HR1]|uniref:beta-propeller domain-containing protein n=1 Tax=Candidatus Izimoplasma sp. HR1 TaxID=1541959 RepID=UPI0004F75B6C|nr:Beta propeller domain protein [Candidatus Izimaplasma bacterium HR1]
MKKIMLFFVSIVFLAGCNGALNDQGCSTGFHKQDDICVEDFNNEGDFESSDDIVNAFLTFNKKQGLMNTRFGWFSTFLFGSIGMNNDSAERATTTSAKGSDDYSETNNQVEGVDEMDNVLTDGKYIYISNYDKIQIVLAYTIEDEYEVLDVVKEITFDDLTPEDGHFYFNGMYVDEDRFIVVGTSNSYTCHNEEPNLDETNRYTYCQYYDYHNTTHVWEYTKDDFKLKNEYELSGYFVGSRKIEDDLYFVTNEYIPFYHVNNEDVDFSIDTYIPNYSINGTNIKLSYSEVMYVEGTEPTNFTTFYGINLDTEEVSTEVILGEGGYNLYVSTENIYLTGTKWNWNNDFIAALEADENAETEEDPYEIETSIVRVEIENGTVSFGAEGSVPGVALDQFAMDENGEYIRIVTTTSNWWWWGNTSEINNRLMVLDMDLNVISTLERIGKEGETVQSTRFVGDYAYVVTFLRTDPFYVIDLSDPENPEKLSELEIPGFSDYLQPIGEDYILGIGYGDNEGGTQGLKISLYDVSDKTHAVVASEIVYPYSDNGYIWTSTVYNHKDLLVSLSKGIIALPYTEYSWGNETNDYHWTYNTGVMVLNLDIENGVISERGRVEHSEADYHDIYVYKSKFIDDYLYTISSKFIKVSTIDDPETILETLMIGESREYYYGQEVFID